MALESGVLATVEVASVPQLPGGRELAEGGAIPGGSRRNLAWSDALLDAGGHDELTRLLLADAQTSGGLVFGVPPERTADALARLADTGHTAARIGHTSAGPAGIALR
jgi:selenide,water dikinase